MAALSSIAVTFAQACSAWPSDVSGRCPSVVRPGVPEMNRHPAGRLRLDGVAVFADLTGDSDVVWGAFHDLAWELNAGRRSLFVAP